MSTGNVLYLLLSIGTFVSLSVVLAYVSWQQSVSGPDMIGTSAPTPTRAHPDSHHGLAS